MGRDRRALRLPVPRSGGILTLAALAKPRAWLAGVLGTAAAAAGTWWFGQQAWHWELDRPATCMPVSCFCEAVRDGAIRQPSNTWSCLAYVFAGCWVLGSWPSGAPRARRANIAGFGLLLLFLGLTSIYFHAALTFKSEWYDAMFLFLMPGYLLVFNLWRARALDGAAAKAVLAAIGAASGLFLGYVLVLRKQAFMLLVASFLFSEWFALRRSGRAAAGDVFWKAAGIFAFAAVIWALDQFRIVCAPTSVWQGHAAWHVLVAAAVWILFFYCDANVASGERA